MSASPFSSRARDGVRLWTRRELDDGVDVERLLASGTAGLLESAGSVAGRGRGRTFRVTVAGAPGVWRTNRHGGLLGGLLGERFWTYARLEEEVFLSETLRGQGIATPRVLLALAERSGPFWRQHLVTEEVPEATTVFEARRDPRALRAASELLDHLFGLGFWAPDLHPGNMLWQAAEQRCWVIDLAAAKVLGRPLTAMERTARRKRFARYFAKHGGSVPEPFQGLLANGPISA